MRRARRSGDNAGFTLVELLVVITIIVVLIAMLLPALVRAREQAAYVAWQSYSHGLQNDPNLVLYFNLQNDAGNNTLTNQAIAADRIPSPKWLDSYMVNYTGSMFVKTIDPTIINPMWAKWGRWRGKPCLTFDPTKDASFQLPATQNRLLGALGHTQQVTIAAWIANPLLCKGSLMSWCDGSSSNIAYNVVPSWISDQKFYWQCGTGALANSYNALAVLDAPKTTWQLWAMTKDSVAGSMKLYLNGELAQQTGGAVYKFADEGVAYCYPLPLNGSLPYSGRTGGCSFGLAPNSGWWGGQVDEIAIWNRVLSDQEIQNMYKQGASY